MSYKIEPIKRETGRQGTSEVSVKGSDDRMARALKALTGGQAPGTDAPNIDVSGRTPSGDARNLAGKAPPLSPQVEGGTHPMVEGQQEPISHLNAKSEPPAADPAQDARMQELIRREVAIREEARRVQAEKEQLKQLKQPGMTAEEWKAQFLQDPTKLGISMQEMADRYLNQPSEQDQAVSALKQEIEQLRAQLDQGQKSIQEAQAQSYENAKRQLRRDTEMLVAGNTAQYEALASDQAFDSVVELIETTYKEDGYLMSVQEAAQQVEDYLTERARKYAGLKKLAVKQDSSPAVPPQTDKQTPPQSQTRTLSNSLSQASRPLTSAERREKAIRAFHGNK